MGRDPLDAGQLADELVDLLGDLRTDQTQPGEVSEYATRTAVIGARRGSRRR